MDFIIKELYFIELNFMELIIIKETKFSSFIMENIIHFIILDHIINFIIELINLKLLFFKNFVFKSIYLIIKSLFAIIKYIIIITIDLIIHCIIDFIIDCIIDFIIDFIKIIKIIMNHVCLFHFIVDFINNSIIRIIKMKIN